jgi:hypothetical protein
MIGAQYDTVQNKGIKDNVNSVCIFQQHLIHWKLLCIFYFYSHQTSNMRDTLKFKIMPLAGIKTYGVCQVNRNESCKIPMTISKGSTPDEDKYRCLFPLGNFDHVDVDQVSENFGRMEVPLFSSEQFRFRGAS